MDDFYRLFLPDWMLFPTSVRAFFEQTLYLIPLLPLAGFAINALLRRRISRGLSGAVACLASAGAFVWALLAFASCAGQEPAMVIDSLGRAVLDRTPAEPLHAVYGTWIQTGNFNVPFGLYLDPLSGVMALVVTGVGTLIHIYSLGYMGHDRAYARYFSYLNLFLFAMLVLILADNLVLLFVGWEGVGLCSYLLIGFWYQDMEKAAAGQKAFIFNRIGDLGFLLGCFALVAIFGTLNFVAPPRQMGAFQRPARPVRVEHGPGPLRVILPEQPGMLDIAEGVRRLNPGGHIRLDWKTPELTRFSFQDQMGARVFPNLTFDAALTVACLLLFIGACGKSAQLPLYAWLPDAMAGPTPVSALIHAATMVTAGIYLVARTHPLFLFSETALGVVATVGALTAVFAALVGLTQTDIKKVLAYSTVSQLGYMFLGLGAAAFSAALFHVVTHAFFKALLFLGAGSVIHALSGEQDLLKMGGLRKRMPITFWCMLAGALALAGAPPFAGWWSKDEILVNVLALAQQEHSTGYYLLYAMGILGAFCTAVYTTRLMALAFFGTSRTSAEVRAHIHESPPSMTLPLIVLGVFSATAGILWHEALPRFLAFPDPGYEMEAAHHQNFWWTLLAWGGGIGLAGWLYLFKGLVPRTEPASLWVRLSRNKFYLEGAYDLLARLFGSVAEILHLIVEVLCIDTLLVGGVAFLARRFSWGMRWIQPGLINAYAAGILAGVLIVLYVLGS